MNYQEIAATLEQWDYLIIHQEGVNIHIAEAHGEYHISGDDADFVYSGAVRHFLSYTLGKEYRAVWNALKKAKQHKVIFEFNYKTIDKMMAWDAEFISKWQAKIAGIFEDYPEQEYPDDLPF